MLDFQTDQMWKWRDLDVMLVRELQDPFHFVEREIRAKGRDMDGFEEVDKAISYMGKVIENIAVYEKLEQGQIQLDEKRFALGDVLDYFLREWKNNLGQMGVRLLFEVSLGGKYYCGDAGRILQCLGHVMGNCARSVPDQSEINLWVREVDQGDGTSHISITVEYMGVPVGENSFGRVCSADSEGNAPAWRRGEGGDVHVGTCCSLMIAGGLAELMGGTIRLGRVAGMGNRIEVMLPLRHVRNAADGEGGVGAPGGKIGITGELDSLSFLLVEWEDRIFQSMGPQLKLEGAAVDVARTGREGMDLWLGSPKDAYDAVLVGADLPDMDYLEFAVKFRQQCGAEAKKIPLFAILGESGSDTVRESMRAGVNAVLGKPLDFKRLRRIFDMVGKCEGSYRQ